MFCLLRWQYYNWVHGNEGWTLSYYRRIFFFFFTLLLMMIALYNPCSHCLPPIYLLIWTEWPSMMSRTTWRRSITSQWEPSAPGYSLVSIYCRDLLNDRILWLSVPQAVFFLQFLWLVWKPGCLGGGQLEKQLHLICAQNFIIFICSFSMHARTHSKVWNQR